jgi:hypothetical protein
MAIDTGVVLTIVGLLIGIIVFGVILFTVWRVFGGLMKGQAEMQRLLQTGERATARVLEVQHAGMSVTAGAHRHVQLRIGLEVHPPGMPPFHTLLTTLVSELSIAQLVPGSTVTVRFDRQNPHKLALESVGAAAAMVPAPGYGAPGHPQPAQGPPGYGPAGYAQPAGYAPGPGWGVGVAPGAGVPAAGIPVAPMRVPRGAKIGLVLGLLGGLIGVGVGVVVVAVNVLGISLGGDDDSICGQAAACCKIVSAGTPAESACDNYKKIGVPEDMCEKTLQGLRSAAAMQGKSCP